MMRYQRVSPDIIPLSNGSKKPSSKSFEDDFTATTAGHFDSKKLRARSVSASDNPSPTREIQLPQISLPSESFTASIAITTEASQVNNHDTTTVVGYAAIGVGADEMFSWGHRKRSRGTRIASMSASPQRRPGKILRQSAIAAAEKVAAAAEKAMPPPSCAGGFYTRGSSLRSSSLAQMTSRGTEDRSVCLTRTDKRSPPSPPEKAQRMSANGGIDFSMNTDSKQQPSDQETGGSGATATVAEKLNLDNFEWPRIYLSLSRKEKEDDFLAMKGAKLPQRPKKRAKNIDKTLQYCFPGLWLADLTRGRYEVREKKCVKKKKRGLKGMESMDSDSE